MTLQSVSIYQYRFKRNTSQEQWRSNACQTDRARTGEQGGSVISESRTHLDWSRGPPVRSGWWTFCCSLGGTRERVVARNRQDGVTVDVVAAEAGVALPGLVAVAQLLELFRAAAPCGGTSSQPLHALIRQPITVGLRSPHGRSVHA
jgi:hypothetical protein